MPVEIRAAEPVDIPVLLSLLRELAAYEKLTDRVQIDEALMAEYVFGEHAVAEALIGFQDCDPVCYALFYPVFPSFRGLPWLYLEDLYVQPRARGCGVGRAMISHLARIAIDRGWDAMAWGVLEWNEPALKFYETLGAVRSTIPVQMELSREALERLADGCSNRT